MQEKIIALMEQIIEQNNVILELLKTAPEYTERAAEVICNDVAKINIEKVGEVL